MDINYNKSKKYIYFKNDDVYCLDEQLKKIINIFINNGVPLHLSIIPNRLSNKCKEYLMDLKTRNADLIEIGQHGFNHTDHSLDNGMPNKYEFGHNRTRLQQKQDIARGKKILTSIQRKINVFTPPWHNFNNETLEILKEQKYEILATDLKTPPHSKTNLTWIPIHIFLDKQIGKRHYIEKTEKIIREIKDKSSEVTGLLMHHRYYRDNKDFKNLEKIICFLKNEPRMKIVFLSKGRAKSVKNSEINSNVLLYFLTYQFVPKPMAISTDSLNPYNNLYHFTSNRPPLLLRKSEDEIGKLIYSGLKKSIKKSLPPANTPIGILLSGGLDSAVILHITREIFQGKIFTLTAAYSEDSQNLAIARKVAKEYSTIHQELIIKPQNLIRLKEIYQHYIHQPIGDNGLLSLYLMMEKMAKHNIRYILAGDGADCLFGGLKMHYFNFIKKTALPFEHYHYGEIFLSSKESEIFFKKDIRLTQPLEYLSNRIKTRDILKRQTLIDLNFLVNNRIDYLLTPSRIFEVNLTLPYLDENFVKLALAIPSAMLIKENQQKYILKKAFSKRLPKEVLLRKKEGFTPPFWLWYNTNKDFVIKNIMKSTELGIPYSYAKYLIYNIKNSRRYELGMKIWLVLNFSLWCENRV